MNRGGFLAAGILFFVMSILAMTVFHMYFAGWFWGLFSGLQLGMWGVKKRLDIK